MPSKEVKIEVKIATFLATSRISKFASVLTKGDNIKVHTTMADLQKVIEEFLEQANISGVQVVVVENL